MPTVTADFPRHLPVQVNGRTEVVEFDIWPSRSWEEAVEVEPSDVDRCGSGSLRGSLTHRHRLPDGGAPHKASFVGTPGASPLPLVASFERER
jgi:hypothetical protein